MRWPLVFNRWQYLVVQSQEMKMNMSKKKAKSKDQTANLVKTAPKHKEKLNIN